MVVSKIPIQIKVIMDEFLSGVCDSESRGKSVKGLSINVKLDFYFCTSKCAAV